MTYREIAPVPQLRGIVQCVWTLEGDGVGVVQPEPVLPDGRPELILHFGDPFERIGADRSGAVVQPSIIFAGQLTSQLLLRPTGRVSVVGIRFHPHGALYVLPMPQHELAGLTIDVGLLDVSLRRELETVDASDNLDRAAIDVQTVLVRWIHPKRLDPRICCAVETIERTHGQVSVEALSRACEVTRRHLERRFLDHVGTTPKRLARIVRFQHALRTLQQLDSPRAGLETALTCGYADQSHFIRDFRQLAGCSPSEHLLRHAELTGFFIS